MDGERLTERRKWFRVFPEGTLEFTIITRVLALVLLVSLAVVGPAQRPFALTALAFVLWADYALLMWWMIQVATDLLLAIGKLPNDTPSSRVRLGFKIILPSVAVLLAVIPWTQLLLVLGFTAKAEYFRFAPIAGGVLFVLFFIPAYKSLLRIGVNSPLWASVLLIPIFHWFALHRVAAVMDRRIDSQLRARGFEKLSQRPRLAISLADVTWLLGVVPWLVVIIYVLIRSWQMWWMGLFAKGAAPDMGLDWSAGIFRGYLVCSTMLSALFAIVNLAAMEGVQKQSVTLIRKAAS